MTRHDPQTAKESSPARLLACSLALCALLIPAAAAWADGFHDPGLQQARVRTDYNAVNEGTVANPLTYDAPCFYTSWGWPAEHKKYTHPPCATYPAVFSQSNYWQQNGGGSSSTFWVLSMNNEGYAIMCGASPCNSGPPNQSLPRAAPSPQQDIMGFAASINYAAGENFWRFHLVVDNHQNPVGNNGLPFLAIGAAADRGNGGYIGWLNKLGGRHRLMFSMKLEDYNLGTS